MVLRFHMAISFHMLGSLWVEPSNWKSTFTASTMSHCDPLTYTHNVKSLSTKEVRDTTSMSHPSKEGGSSITHNIKTYTNIRQWSTSSIKMLIFLVYYIIGVVYYHVNEGWNVLDCVYYITVTTTTVGKYQDNKGLFVAYPHDLWIYCLITNMLWWDNLILLMWPLTCW